MRQQVDGMTDSTIEEPIAFVVEDTATERQTLEKLLASVGMDVHAYASAEEFLDDFDAARPGCLILDIRLRGMSGLQLQEILRDRKVILPIIFVTAYSDVPMAVRAMEQGAFKFVQKPYNPQELLDMVHEAVQRSLEDTLRHREFQAIQQRYDALTVREREVMALVVGGDANKTIAAKLGLSKKTVDTVRQNVMKRMEAANLPELVCMSLFLGTYPRL